jgi:hypothetical protein
MLKKKNKCCCCEEREKKKSFSYEMTALFYLFGNVTFSVGFVGLLSSLFIVTLGNSLISFIYTIIFMIISGILTLSGASLSLFIIALDIKKKEEDDGNTKAE